MDIHMATIDYEDVMRECHIEDPVQFRRVLRRNGFQQSPYMPVEHKTADAIVKRLTGHEIDWYKYRREKRDSVGDGPLERSNDPANREKVKTWFSKIITEGSSQQTATRDRFLGFVCSGGFLEGAQGTEFHVGLSAGLNVFIGDRGAGKSTVLNLLGLLADSVSEQTAALATQLLEVLNPVQHETVSIGKRVLKSLRQYGIDQYGCFFVRAQKTYCYYVDVPSRTFDLLELGPEVWTSVEAVEGNLGFQMYMLRQGEVIRISEVRNRFYLNSILDALYPDLYDKRKEFSRNTQALLGKLDFYTPTKPRIKPSEIRHFLRERSEELNRIWADIRRGSFSDNSIALVRGYVDRCHEMVRPKKETPIVALLEGDENAYYYLYLGRIIGFLSGATRYLEEMQADLHQAMHTDSATKKSSWLPNTDADGNESDLLEALSLDKATLERMEEQAQNANESTAHPESIATNDQQTADAELFLAALEAESINPLRAYPKTLAARKAINAQANSSIAK